MTVLEHIAQIRKANFALWKQLENLVPCWPNQDYEDVRIFTLEQAKMHLPGEAKRIVTQISENDHKVANLLKIFADAD